MYEHTPGTVLEWIAAVPGHIPEQAVMFENHSQGDAMFVANVRLATSRKAGMFISNSQCAEYHIRKKQSVGCSPTFDFLVLKRGKYATWRQVTIRNVLAFLLLSIAMSSHWTKPPLNLSAAIMERSTQFCS